jgi:hypothetical protein
MAVKITSHQYTPAELKEAISILQNNRYHCFEPGDASGIVIALHKAGFKIVKTGEAE